MKRKVTQEERDILLNNPELVMFEPYGAMKVHRASLGKALIMPFITGALFFAWGFLCPDFINEHPTLFAAVGCITLVLASGFLPILYFILDEKAEGGWIIDGRKEPFCYNGCVNYFMFEPKTEVAIIYGEKFYAYIKRDPKTESFYC